MLRGRHTAPRGEVREAANFAAAVAKLEGLIGAPLDERKMAEGLQWSRSRLALIALGQEARASGLVRIFYNTASGERRYPHASESLLLMAAKPQPTSPV